MRKIPPATRPIMKSNKPTANEKKTVAAGCGDLCSLHERSVSHLHGTTNKDFVAWLWKQGRPE